MIEVDCQISIKRNGICFLDEKKIGLLYGIMQNGSLIKTAKKFKLSYQHAWNIIDEINKAAASPIVIKKRGGVNGGGAELSNYGIKLIKEYEMIEDQVLRIISQINVELNL